MRAHARSVTTAHLPDPGSERAGPTSGPHTAEPEPPRGLPARWISLLWRIGAAVRAAHSSSVPF